MKLARCSLSLSMLAVALALAGCGGSAPGAADERTVVAAFYPLAWAAEQVGGDSVDVVNLTPAGAEPHDLELSPRDVETVDDARLVVYLGSGFQPALERAVADRSGASLDLLRKQELLTRADDEGGVASDPHVWLDPMRYAAMVEAIATALGDPSSAQATVAELRRLDAEYRHGLAYCERREIVTSHAAFGYLAAAYDLDQVALMGLSPEAEPSPRSLEDLVDVVKEHGATTVFVEPLASPRIAETIAREAGVDTAPLDPIEGLDADALAAGADYLSVMRDNLVTLRKALGCR